MHHPARSSAELPITLDRGSEHPLPTQLAAALREAIDGGGLRAGEALPATRRLGHALGVSRGVVVAAYEQLVAEGYLVAGHGRGTAVNPRLSSAFSGPGAPAGLRHAAELATPGERASLHRGSHAGSHTGSQASSQPSPYTGSHPGGGLAPGLAATTAVDTPAWRAAWRRAATRAHLVSHDLGEPALRTEIVEHLRRMRGTVRPADDVIITAGARDGLGLLMSALGARAERGLVIGVEDPGYPSLRRFAARHGATILALPVDADGLVTESLPEHGLDAVIVTPSHQYPLGGSLPLERRHELLAWAARTGAVIVEDDYDSELRHAGSPLPALAALDDPSTGTVVTLGTFSKTISPALSTGYLLAPERLLALLAPVRHDLGCPVSAVVQAALADFLAHGEFRRHTTRMRRRYARRRDLVVDLLHGIPNIRVRPMSGGLHAVIEFVPGAAESEGSRTAASATSTVPASPPASLLAPTPIERERRVVTACDDAGLGAVPLSTYWHEPGHARPAATELYGLVIGTGGNLDGEGFEAALTALRTILTADEFLTAEG